MKTSGSRGGIIIALMVAVCVVGLTGCGGATKPVVKPPPGDVKVDLTTPENATRTVLLTIQAELRACAHDDMEAAEKLREQLLAISTADSIGHQLARLPRFKAMLGEDMVKGYIRNWGSKIAYYAEGLHFDRWRRGAADEETVAVIVPASGPDDDALIQVLCLRQKDNNWHVARIEFVTPTLAAAAESQPGSQPATEP